MPLVAGRDVRSPFELLVVTEYYDGEAAGLARDARGTWFAFRLLDWSDDYTLRVFALGAVLAAGLDAAARALDDGSRPNSSFLLTSSSDSSADLAVISAAESSFAPRYIVVARSLLKSFALCEERSDIELPTLSVARLGHGSTNWLEQLGFQR